MNCRAALLILVAVSCSRGPSNLPDPATVDRYVSEFNASDEELYHEHWANDSAAEFLKSQIPLFECPDKEVEKTYYFRWWVYRKHIRLTDGGYVVTEFMPDVFWAGPHNTINCPAMMHIAEGRWLRDKSIVRDYLKFWSTPDSGVRNYSFPVADAAWQYYLVSRDSLLLSEMLPFLKDNYAAWEADRRDSIGLFWQRDLLDGMECSVSGKMAEDWTGYRPTINSYMYADARAIARISHDDLYNAKADTLKSLMDSLLWDSQKQFYMAVPRHSGMARCPSRELIGYVPWEYGLPDRDKLSCWLQISDTCGFNAPFGPTTVERRSPGFAVRHEPDPEGFGAQWNGPVWPFATTQTLGALAETLRRYGETEYADRLTFFNLFRTYSYSQRMGDVCWIDENQDPFTGEWILRRINADRGSTSQSGKDYNHSSYADILISDLVGIQPQENGSIAIEPLIPEGEWDWFCLSGVSVCGHEITVLYDRTGSRYGCGRGLSVFADGKMAAHQKGLRPCVCVF